MMTDPSSEHYLIPALQVAFSLADQICKSEEADQFPTPSSDWIDSIMMPTLEQKYYRPCSIIVRHIMKQDKWTEYYILLG
eukprot:scaffold13647_cov146-Skeletonema_marinoi.AAC.4